MTISTTMKQTSTLAAFLLLLLTGCDSGGDSGNDSVRYSVRYEASGTFVPQCNIIYITRKDGVSADQENEGGQGINLPSHLPWSTSFDVTVTQLRPFNLYIGAVCGGGNENTVAEVRLYVDDQLVASGQDVGSVVSAEAEYVLSLGD